MAPSWFPLLLFLALSLDFKCYCQDPHEEEMICSSQDTCTNCLRALPTCAWCSQELNQMLLPFRCGHRDSEILKQCDSSQITFPNSTLTKTTDNPLGRKIGSDDDVQIRPQRVQIQLRPKETFRVELNYKQAGDYPVDLYYLLDLSFSMLPDKKNLEALGDVLAQTMKNITSKFQIGFGSFVDKPVLPFTSTAPLQIRDPCNNGCAPTYGFRNEMSLNRNTASFSQKVRDSIISANLDGPEGGLDAIMQAIVCKEIGWREKSRKLLVFSTDAGFHIAGDGKLGGIVKPNDESCHLDNKGYYTESTKQDYPSIAQIRRQIRERKVNLIMAVDEGVLPLYGELSKNIPGSSTGQLDKDSKNVVQLIRDQYAAITDVVELYDNSSKHVSITYFSKCTSDKYEETKSCRGLKVGTEVAFDLNIRVISCPPETKDWNEIIAIRPVGLSESTIIELNIICQCDCERQENAEKLSRKCSSNGTYECGICNCNKDRYGVECECSTTSGNLEHNISVCKRGNETSVCSGRGSCRCGQCICDKREDPEEIVSGMYCEIDNYSCNRVDGKVCGGTDRGICEFGKCTCRAEWTGDSCECTNTTCFQKNQDSPCNGHGICECGQCNCEEDEGGRFTGVHCDVIKTKEDDCNDLTRCYNCMSKGPNGEKAEDCEVECPSKGRVRRSFSGSPLVCPFVMTEKVNCKHTITFHPDRDKPVISEECSKDNTIHITLGAIAGTLLIGLLFLLLWKAVTVIHDHREYARFESERSQSIWADGNPLYKGAVSEFQNPTFSNK